ncbi:hypothetical protein H8E07_12435 [bacterium]|nr:hypothetical protein [bacterium]
MRTRLMLIVTLVCFVGLAAVAQAGCWTGNGISDPGTNYVRAEVWPGDLDLMGTLTAMDFFYTTDGTDPKTSGTFMTTPGQFLEWAANNDRYEAWLFANNGDLVRWYVESLSADGDVCESAEFQFTSGVTPPAVPNLIGSCESELGVGGDWDPGDALTDMLDLDMDGIFTVTLTAAADFTDPNPEGYQVIEVGGAWGAPQFPGDSNVPIAFTAGTEITFYLDTNPMAGWAPEINAASDSFLAADTHTWAAVGGWQGWDPTNPATQMTPMGGGVYMVTVPFDASMAGTHDFKCAADGGWDLQCGVNGYGGNSSTWSFEVTAEVYVEFYFHVSGRVKVVVTDTVANEDQTWGQLKALYR